MNQLKYLRLGLRASRRSLASYGLLLLILCSSGCGDRISWGYVNKRSHAVTIVRHAGDDQIRTTLGPSKYLAAGTGPNLPFDLLGPDGAVLGRYKPAEIAVIGDDPISYVVIQNDGVRVEPRELALRDVDLNR